MGYKRKWNNKEREIEDVKKKEEEIEVKSIRKK